VFTDDGAFRRAFGHDVIPGGGTGFEVCGASCKQGLEGGTAGQLSVPGGIAIDCRGSIYVADTGNDRVQRFGEPQTALPPCGVAGGASPSNELVLGKLKRNKRRGTAKLTLELAGKRLREIAKTVESAGAFRLAVKPKGKAKRKLARKGKARVRSAVTYVPTGGDPNKKSKRVKLKR
jgi:NHL repeat